jgi:hypothetical protein
MRINLRSLILAFIQISSLLTTSGRRPVTANTTIDSNVTTIVVRVTWRNVTITKVVIELELIIPSTTYITKDACSSGNK